MFLVALRWHASAALVGSALHPHAAPSNMRTAFLIFAAALAGLVVASDLGRGELPRNSERWTTAASASASAPHRCSALT
jgi:hypothetical protein